MAADKKGAAKKKKPYNVYKLYSIEGDKVVRKGKWSPKAGEGYFLASHKDRLTCGKTGYMEKKSKPAPTEEKKSASSSPDQ